MNRFSAIPATLLVVFSLSACTSKPVRFVSYPDGAEVSVGKSKCIAPCDMKVSKQDQYVYATLPDGRTRKVEIPKEIGEPANTVGNALGGIGESLSIGGVIFAGIALLSAHLFFADLDDDEKDNSVFQRNIGLIGLSSAIAAFVLMKTGDEVGKLNPVNNSIEIDFKYSDESEPDIRKH